MKKRILVIGGTGLIGSRIAQLLRTVEPDHSVFIGSRKAQPNDPSVLKLDVNQARSLHILKTHKIDVVVMSVADPNDHVLAYCISHQIDYFDITKSAPELRSAANLTQKKAIKSQVVFNSGWLGGLVSSLLAYAEPQKSTIEAVRLVIFYSMQEAGGENSTYFLAEHVAEPFDYYKNSKPVATKHFLNPTKHDFSFGIGTKTVYDLDLSDVFILHHIEQIPTVDVKAAFSSAPVTKLLYWFQKWGIWRRLPLKMRVEAFKSRGNGDKIVFEIEWTTNGNKRKISVIDTEGQAHLTPLVTVLTLQNMLDTAQKGVFYGHQLHDPTTFYQKLIEYPSIKVLVQ